MNHSLFIACHSPVIWHHAYGGVVNISSFSLHATILHMSLLHPSSCALLLCTLLHAVSSGIWHRTYGGVVNIFFSFFLYMAPSCTCHCFICHSCIIITYIIACCFICHCAYGGVVNFSLSPYTPSSCTSHLIIINLFIWRYIIFYHLLSLYI